MYNRAVGRNAAWLPVESTQGLKARNVTISPMYPAPMPMPEMMPRLVSPLTLTMSEL